MRRATRGDRFAEPGGDDPAAGLVNLFDLWMVFAVAVLLTVVGAARGELQRLQGEARPLEERLLPTGRTLDGSGERLGVAYRLSTGEVVYVPEGDEPTGR